MIDADRYDLVGLPNALVRFGLRHRTEFQLMLPSINWISGGWIDETEFSNGYLRFKTWLTEQDGATPALGMTLTAGMPVFENLVASRHMWGEMALHLNWAVIEGVNVVPTGGLYLLDPAGLLQTYGVLLELRLHERVWLVGDYNGIADEGESPLDRASGRLCVHLGSRATLGAGLRQGYSRRAEPGRRHGANGG